MVEEHDGEDTFDDRAPPGTGSFTIPPRAVQPPPPASYAAPEITMHIAPGVSKAELLKAIHFLAGLHWHGTAV